jgi:hypothetical protein
MTQQLEAMKLALDWIKDATVVLSHTSSAIQGGIGAEAEGVGGCSVAVEDALRQAIEQSQKQEPVAFVVKHYVNDDRPSIKGNGFDGLEIGYTREEADEFIAWVNTHIIASPQRQPLTDEEIAKIASTPCAVVGSYVHTFARAIEAAHGITGEQK